MRDRFVEQARLPDMPLWRDLKDSKDPISFELELTARCNNDCRHCYINLPADDREAVLKEMSTAKIKDIVDQAASLGVLWCLMTGGEPLLRKDFFEIYMYIKQKGILVTVFTNAALITMEHIKFFKRYPPRDIEVTVYGVTADTYERVTRRPGSFAAFMRGLTLLLENGIRVRFKTMALRSNIDELEKIADFCRERTKDYFRFDPFLHLRYDSDPKKNEDIISERLTTEEIVLIEKRDDERFGVLQKNCDKLISPESAHINCDHLFHCGAGEGSFSVSYDGYFRLCASLYSPDCMCDLKSVSLAQAWRDFIPKVRNMRSGRREFLEKCRKCQIVNLCMWCPAHSYLETGKLDTPVEYFCEVARGRAGSLQSSVK